MSNGVLVIIFLSAFYAGAIFGFFLAALLRASAESDARAEDWD